MSSLEQRAKTIHREVAKYKEILKHPENFPSLYAQEHGGKYLQAAETDYQSKNLLKMLTMVNLAEKNLDDFSFQDRKKLSLLKIRAYRDWGEDDLGYQLFPGLFGEEKLANLPDDIQIYYLDLLLDKEDYQSFELIFKKLNSEKKFADSKLYQWSKELLRKKQGVLAQQVLSEISSGSNLSAQSLYLQALAIIYSGNVAQAVSLFSECQKSAEKAGDKDLSSLSRLSQGRLETFLERLGDAEKTFKAIVPDSQYYPEAQYELILLQFRQRDYQGCWENSMRLTLFYPLDKNSPKFYLAQASCLLEMGNQKEALQVFYFIKQRYLKLRDELDQVLLHPSTTGLAKLEMLSYLEVMDLLSNSQAEAGEEYQRVGLEKRISELKREIRRVQDFTRALKNDLYPSCQQNETGKTICQVQRMESDLSNLEKDLEKASRRFLPKEFWKEVKEISAMKRLGDIRDTIHKLNSSPMVPFEKLITLRLSSVKAGEIIQGWIQLIRRGLEREGKSELREEGEKLLIIWKVVLETERGLAEIQTLDPVAKQFENYPKLLPVLQYLESRLPPIEARFREITRQAEQVKGDLELSQVRGALQEEKEVFFSSLVAMTGLTMQQQTEMKTQIQGLKQERDKKTEELHDVFQGFREKASLLQKQITPVDKKEEKSTEYYRQQIEDVSEKVKEMEENFQYLKRFFE